MIENQHDTHSTETTTTRRTQHRRQIPGAWKIQRIGPLLLPFASAQTAPVSTGAGCRNGQSRRLPSVLQEHRNPPDTMCCWLCYTGTAKGPTPSNDHARAPDTKRATLSFIPLCLYSLVSLLLPFPRNPGDRTGPRPLYTPPSLLSLTRKGEIISPTKLGFPSFVPQNEATANHVSKRLNGCRPAAKRLLLPTDTRLRLLGVEDNNAQTGGTG